MKNNSNPFLSAILLCMVTLLMFSCEHEMHGKCFDEKNINACGEICQGKNDSKACALQGELGVKQCMEGNQLKVCSYMCLFGKDGKDLYCKKQKELCAEPQNKQNDDCALMN